jgi:hypothetical protein
MLEVFGTLAAAMMVTCYALEERGPRFTLAFAGSCAAASVYAYAIGSWPFFVLEAVWAVVALRRGLRRLSNASAPVAPKTERGI